MVKKLRAYFPRMSTTIVGRVLLDLGNQYIKDPKVEICRGGRSTSTVEVIAVEMIAVEAIAVETIAVEAIAVEMITVEMITVEVIASCADPAGGVN